MTGPDPAVAAVRRAVRGHLADVPPGGLVLVACSGGPDSLALLAGATFEAGKEAVRVGAVVVDHGLQPGSERVAAEAAETARGLGADPVLVRSVTPPRGTGAGGPEAAARTARYAAFAEAATELSAYAVWLGHTLDDQAEQVLLGLARGSGTRSLAGMPRRRPPYERPLLGLPKATTVAACRALGLRPWTDPTNADPTYRRNRVRAALADLERDLGPGLARALARTADLARQDADALDELAAQARVDLGAAPWRVAQLAGQPRAVQARVLRALAAEAGCPEVTAAHVEALAALVTGPRGQGPTYLPGGIVGRRRGDLFEFAAAAADRLGAAAERARDPGYPPVVGPGRVGPAAPGDG